MVTYTFHIRKGVYFQDNACFPGGKGREMNANDIKYSFMRVLDPRTGTLGFDFYKNYVKGAKEYFYEIQKAVTENREPKIKDVSGYIVQDDSTFQIIIIKPFGPFIYYLCQAFCYVVPHEAVEKYGKDFFQNPVGTGPFIFENWRPDLEINLHKNPNYWGKDEFGNSLPYLERIKFRFIKDLSQQMLEFTNGTLDESYRIPNEILKSVVTEDGMALTPEYSKYVLQRKNALADQYFVFLTSGKIFNDVKVRQSFNYAIDRDKLVKFVLYGSGTTGIYGIVPPGMPNYDVKSIKGYGFDVEKGKAVID
jgi:peptide/nickel transport system substrate-binding protein